MTSTHGKVLIEIGKILVLVSGRDGLALFVRFCSVQCKDLTYTEELDMVKDLVVEREVIAWDDVHAGFLLNLPMFVSQSLALAKQVL